MKAVVGEEALSPEDKLALEFLEKFETQFVGQGMRDYHIVWAHTHYSYRSLRVSYNLRVSRFGLDTSTDLPQGAP